MVLCLVLLLFTGFLIYYKLIKYYTDASSSSSGLVLEVFVIMFQLSFLGEGIAFPSIGVNRVSISV